MIVVAICLLLLSRGVVVFSLSPICNYFRKSPINLANQFVIWFSGMRGAVAFALALCVPTKNADVIITTTQYLILFTIGVLGVSAYPLIKYLKLSADDFVVSRHGDSMHKAVTDNPDLNIDDRPAGIFDKLEEYDREYFQDWLIRSDSRVRMP